MRTASTIFSAGNFGHALAVLGVYSSGLSLNASHTVPALMVEPSLSFDLNTARGTTRGFRQAHGVGLLAALVAFIPVGVIGRIGRVSEKCDGSGTRRRPHGGSG